MITIRDRVFEAAQRQKTQPVTWSGVVTLAKLAGVTERQAQSAVSELLRMGKLSAFYVDNVRFEKSRYAYHVAGLDPVPHGAYPRMTKYDIEAVGDRVAYLIRDSGGVDYKIIIGRLLNGCHKAYHSFYDRSVIESGRFVLDENSHWQLANPAEKPTEQTTESDIRKAILNVFAETPNAIRSIERLCSAFPEELHAKVAAVIEELLVRHDLNFTYTQEGEQRVARNWQKAILDVWEHAWSDVWAGVTHIAMTLEGAPDLVVEVRKLLVGEVEAGRLEADAKRNYYRPAWRRRIEAILSVGTRTVGELYALLGVGSLKGQVADLKAYLDAQSWLVSSQDGRYSLPSRELQSADILSCWNDSVHAAMTTSELVAWLVEVADPASLDRGRVQVALDNLCVLGHLRHTNGAYSVNWHWVILDAWEHAWSPELLDAADIRARIASPKDPARLQPLLDTEVRAGRLEYDEKHRAYRPDWRRRIVDGGRSVGKPMTTQQLYHAVEQHAAPYRPRWDVPQFETYLDRLHGTKLTEQWGLVRAGVAWRLVDLQAAAPSPAESPARKSSSSFLLLIFDAEGQTLLGVADGFETLEQVEHAYVGALNKHPGKRVLIVEPIEPPEVRAVQTTRFELVGEE